MEVSKVDVLVIGAGPAGTLAASEVHKNGLGVMVVEKQLFPRFVIGESLLPRCMDNLDECGFLDVLNQKGFQKKKGVKFLKNGKTCKFDFEDQFTHGWSWTWQVPRADFDKVLADELENRGVPIHYQTSVSDIQFLGSNSITTVEDNNGNQYQIQAKFIIDASGYGRVLPKLLDLNLPSDLEVRQTMFAHVSDPYRPPGIDRNRIIYYVPETEVYIWVIPFSTGITSLGFVSGPEYFGRFTGNPTERFREMIASVPQAQERFGNAEFKYEPREIKGFAIGIKKLFGEGFVLTGNSTEFLDPIFSSGVTFATESGLLAGKLASKQLKGGSVDWQSEYADYIMHGVEVFKTYVSAWYDGSLQDIFFYPNGDHEIRKQICSVLAGYVWDQTNPFVRKHKTALASLAKYVNLQS